MEYYFPEKKFIPIESVLIKFYDIRDEQKNKIVSFYVNAILVDNLIIDQEFENDDLHFIGNKESYKNFVECNIKQNNERFFAKLKNFMIFSGSSTDSYNICKKNNKIMASSFSSNAVIFKCKDTDIYANDVSPKTECPSLSFQETNSNSSSLSSTSENFQIPFNKNIYANLLSIFFLNKNYTISQKIPKGIEFSKKIESQLEVSDLNCNDNCISCFKEKCFKCKIGYELISFSYCEKFPDLIFNKFTSEYELVFNKLKIFRENKLLLSVDKKIYKKAFLLINMNLQFENQNEESIIDFYLQNKKIKSMIKIPQKNQNESEVLESSTLYWGIPLNDIRTFSASEMKNSVFSSLDRYFVNNPDELNKNFLILHYKIKGNQKIHLNKIKYKIHNEKEICLPSTYFSLDYDCDFHCIDPSVISNRNKNKFLSIKNEISNNSQEKSNF